MAKANDIKNTPAVSCEIDATFGGMTLTFSNGKTLSLRAHQLSESIGAQALWHGLKQKLVDAAAIGRDPDTGRSATIDDKYNAVREVYDRLLAGEWNKTREGGAATGGVMLRALMLVYPSKTKDQLAEYLKGKSAAEKAALKLVPKIASAIDTIMATKVADVDTDALLDELDD